MAHFLRNGNTFRVADNKAMDIHDSLPVGTYTVKLDQYGNYFLEDVENFTRPSKIYGDCTKNTDRILNTFLSRTSSTGVMLTGEKGSGKTLLAKNLSMTAAEKGIPTLVINTPLFGESFNKFIQDINQPVVVIFDEFEKVYNSEDQEFLLTLLDGVYESQKLFVLTCNDKWRIDQHMRNRPGRIYYMIDFSGLDWQFIEEFCSENLLNTEHVEKVCKISQMFSKFNFDMLKALVEEMNRYDESPQEALSILNAKAEFDSGTNYEVNVTVDNKVVYQRDRWNGNPLAQRGIEFEFDPDPDDDDSEYVYIRLTPENLKDVDIRQGRFVFYNNKENATVTLTKKSDVITHSYYDYF